MTPQGVSLTLQGMVGSGKAGHGTARCGKAWDRGFGPGQLS